MNTQSRDLTEYITIKPASFGSVSHGTLKTEDLLDSFAGELDWQIRRNGEYFSRPENFTLRDKLNTLVGEAQDQWKDDGTELLNEEVAYELLNELQDALSKYFAPYYGYFGAHEGDGSDFGYWVNIDDVKDQVCFISSKCKEYPDDDFQGEWLHVNDHGNCTLYVRENGKDSEVWGVA